VAPVVRRERLDTRLADAVRRPVTVVTAPPGAGKTTLVASWAADRMAGSVLWLTLGPGHDEPGLLARTVRASLSTVADEPMPFQPGVELALLDATFRAAARTSQRRVLVLDDAHEVRTPSARSVLRHLVRRAPPNLDVVVVGRDDPSLLDTVAFGADRLGLIAESDLLFSSNEARALFVAHGLKIRRADAAALWRRTEGWAGGLAMAALALKRGADPHRLAEDPSTTDPTIADALLADVLGLLAPEERDFVLRTSIVERIDDGLATVLTDDPEAPQRLAALERRGLFLGASLDGRWYRYHPLLAALLRGRLRREHPGLGRRLHRAAATWFSGCELLAEAEEQAREAEDWNLVGRLAQRRFLESFRRGEVTGSTDAGVPRALVLRHRSMAAVAAGEASARGHEADARAFLGAVDAMARPLMADGRRRRALGSEQEAVLAAYVLHGCAFGATDAAIRSARALCRSRADEELRTVAWLRRAELHLDRGRVRAAQGLLEELAVGPRARWTTWEANAYLALVWALLGQATDAERLAEEVAEQAAGRCSTAHVAALALELARAQRGRRAARDAAGTAGPAFVGSRPLATCRRVLRAADGRQVWLDAAAARHPLAGPVLLGLGVLEFIDDAGMVVPVGGPLEQALHTARRNVAAGAYAAVRSGLDLGLAALAPDAHPRSQVEFTTLRAVAAVHLGDEAGAIDDLATALSLVDGSGCAAPLFEQAADLKRLLDPIASSSGRHQSLARSVLDAAGGPAQVELLDPLTQRELAVLGLLPSLMTYDEIAGALHVSVNTVKSHLKVLYRKLGVDRRRQAVLRARQLELLPNW
jgi:LuxR family maltose regulon positive regulatory protein